MRKTSLQNNRGLTLIELIVTMVVAGILIMIAIPNFRNVIKNTQLTTDVNGLISTFSFARSEAVKRSATITVCRSSDSMSADVPGTPVPSCTTASSGWESGWITFVDTNGDGVRDADEQLLKIHEPLDTNITLRASANHQNYITYQANGMSTGSAGSAADTFSLCDDRGTASAYSIEVIQTGRVSSSRTATSCP